MVLNILVKCQSALCNLGSVLSTYSTVYTMKGSYDSRVVVAMPSNVCPRAKRGQMRNGTVGEKRPFERKDGRSVSLFLHLRSRTIEGSAVIEEL